MRLLFCLFSEDIGLLPKGLFTRLVDSNRQRPAEFTKKLRQLFTAMSGEHGAFGEYDIAYFDGGLFSDDEAYDLTTDDLAVLSLATALNWSSIEPAIFGTLFERSLDPDKRSQLGAHYTSEDDIRLIVEPVLIEPLRGRWNDVRQKATDIIEKAKGQQKAGQTKSRKALSELLKGFAAELAAVRVLDPACGSGNFLYVSLKHLLDLEKEVSVFAANNGLSGLLPLTNPAQLYGIETNIYAHELASVVVWIGYIQWQYDNGFTSVHTLFCARCRTSVTWTLCWVTATLVFQSNQNGRTQSLSLATHRSWVGKGNAQSLEISTSMISSEFTRDVFHTKPILSVTGSQKRVSRLLRTGRSVSAYWPLRGYGRALAEKC